MGCVSAGKLWAQKNRVFQKSSIKSQIKVFYFEHNSSKRGTYLVVTSVLLSCWTKICKILFLNFYIFFFQKNFFISYIADCCCLQRYERSEWLESKSSGKRKCVCVCVGLRVRACVCERGRENSKHLRRGQWGRESTHALWKGLILSIFQHVYFKTMLEHV